ncbi:AmiS/UreI family transporter [Paracoccus laeviglucosivorans]|uniref:AmiS/UreI family transporter n=1 Tax=Paracoccus laeviglucosivorans TaxID=1197861 RepID=A0A521F0U2_9RHOB|nr:AmiS/UreI family transporter [Paracoccus laeviglucosivorans]SMO89773.1 AmiS/UreI family transporter [Paracoccus laeviglucosivorans]
MTGFVLFYVGAVLVINGLWLLDRIDGREIVVINLVTAVVSGAVVLHDAFGVGANAGSIRNATLSLLFCTTYLWVAWNRLSGGDGRGLGWFSLFVAVTAVPVASRGFLGAGTGAEFWMAANWLAWAVLWFLYFMLLTMRLHIARIAGWITLLTGIFTGWLPGYLMIEGML